MKLEMLQIFTVSGAEVAWGGQTPMASLWHVAGDQSSLSSQVGAGAPGCMSGSCLSTSQLLWVVKSLFREHNVEAEAATTA